MANLELKSVTPISKILVEIKLNYENGSYKMIELKEGQLIKNLIYINDEGKEVAVDGIVKVIKTTEKVVNVADDCAHNTESIFAKKVTPTALVIDSSDVYESDIHVVDINRIVDVDVVETEVLEVSDIKVIDPTLVSFRATSKPECVMWNGSFVEITESEHDAGEYTFTPNGMMIDNNIVFFNASTRIVESVKGQEPDTERSAVVAESITVKTPIIRETYWNKYKDGDKIEGNDDFFTEIAYGVSNETTEVTIGDEVYEAGKEYRLSIGMNAFITSCPFKVVDNVLSIAVPYLMINADRDGDIRVKVNGFDLRIKGGVPSTNILEVGAVNVLGAKAGYINEAEKFEENGTTVILHKRQHRTFAVLFELLNNGEPIPTDTLTYTKKAFSNSDKISYGMNPVQDFKEAKNVMFYYNGFSGDPVTEENINNIDTYYTVVVPGIGTAKFIIRAEESVASV